MPNPDDVKGKAKEWAGKVTDDEDLETEGQVQQVKGAVKGAADRVKDAVKDAKDAVTDRG